MGKIQELPKSSSRLITSSQIITSVYCVVKELVENSLDSYSKNVEVKLEDYGLEKIEVKDNGCGIDKGDIQFVAKPHFTSKINSYSDLEKVSTYGFRGEALGAVCAVAELVITTKTSGEGTGNAVNFSRDGEITSIKPFPCAEGTTLSVKNLFKNIPVRRQYYRSEKNKKNELRKVEDLLIAFGCIQNDVRFALFHNKNLIWQKPSLSSTKNALIHIFGNAVADHLKHSEYIDKQTQRKFEIFLPKLDAPLTCSLSTSSRCITGINRRPVRMKAVDKILKEYYNKAIQNSGKTRYPICFISITVPLTEVDVNIEPNKTAVMLHNSEDILAQFSEMLKVFYSTEVCENNMNPETPVSNQNNTSNSVDFLNTLKVMCDAKMQQSKLAFIANGPVSSLNNSVNDTSNIVNSVQKKVDTSMNKKDITVLGTPKEPSKKKLKTSLSKSDINDHISTLEKFFTSEENSASKLTDPLPNFINGAPSVTIQRMTSNLNNLSSEASNVVHNIDSERITTFAVSANLSSNTNFLSNGNCVNNRKRHLSESSIFVEKLNEDFSKRPTLDLNKQSGDAWSRGLHPSGKILEPVIVLQPKTVNISESSSKVKKDSIDNAKKKESPQQENSPFKRKLTAFDIFCRSNRLEVSAQTPEYNNQQIAQILSEKWSRLSAEEKAVFKNMLDKDYPQDIKNKEKLGRIVSLNLSQEKRDVSAFEAQKKKWKPKGKEKIMTFNIEQMKSSFQNRNNVNLSSENLILMSYLSPGMWIGVRGRKLCIINTFCLQETIIYHRLLETFHFECDPLDVPQSISAIDLGYEAMDVLEQLSNSENNAKIIADERLTANGFNIRFTRGETNKISAELVGMTNNIACYGLSDLNEILKIIKNRGFSAKLSECRPDKIIHYLQMEASRISRQSPACKRVQDVEDLLRQKSHLPMNCNECIHHKPFVNEVYEITSI